MTNSMFGGPGRFYRGNLHTHSTASDGVLSPGEVCRRYAAEGYDFISLTDHFVGLYDYPITDTLPYRTNSFTTIPGAELHSGAIANGELWHILAVGLPFDFTPSNSPGLRPVDDQETGPGLARRARDAGAFVAIAHPHWSGLSDEDARSIDAAHAVEVYNYGCDVDCDRGYGLQTLDLLLTEGRRLSLCATDDAHFATADHFGGWVMVRAEANEPEALLTALKAGDFYSSQGPDFSNIVLEGDEVVVDCSPVSTVILQGPAHPTSAVHGKGIEGARLPLGRLKDAPWLRLTLIDGEGKRAWSNPLWRDGP